MKRPAKSLGLALMAVCALCAMTAAVAQAGKFMTEGNVKATIKGERVPGSTSTFTVEGQEISCETAKAESAGPLSSPAETWTVHPTYSGCTAFGFGGATVNTTGCDHVLQAGKELGEGEFEAAVELTCEKEKKITIVGGTCEVTIAGPQKSSELIGTYSPGAGFWHVFFHDVFDWGATKAKDGFLCPLNGTGETTAKIKETTTLTGLVEGKTVGATYEP